MGRYVLFGTVAVAVLIIGMLLYPTVHTNVSSIDVTGFTALEKMGMVIVSYGFAFFMLYIVYAHIKK